MVAIHTFHFPKAADELYIEGYLSQPVRPWQLPYRAFLPRADQCENLLVSVCASMSTVAFSGFRLEPGYMIAGQATGTAAALAVKSNCAMQKVNYADLRRVLKQQGQVLEVSE
jgi:hypothetical protein